MLPGSDTQTHRPPAGYPDCEGSCADLRRTAMLKQRISEDSARHLPSPLPIRHSSAGCTPLGKLCYDLTSGCQRRMIPRCNDVPAPEIDETALSMHWPAGNDVVLRLGFMMMLTSDMATRPISHLDLHTYIGENAIFFCCIRTR